MGIIPCSHKCKFQSDGYCSLEQCSTVNSLTTDCPYFIDALFNQSNSLTKRVNTDKL